MKISSELEERSNLRRIRREELCKDIRLGLDAAAQGQFVEFDHSLVKNIAEEVKATGRQHKG